MSKHNTFRKVIAAAAIASAIGLTSLVSGAASADGNEKVYFSIALTNGNATASVPLIYQALTRNEAIKAPAPAQAASINFTKIEYKYTPYDDQHK